VLKAVIECALAVSIRRLCLLPLLRILSTKRRPFVPFFIWKAHGQHADDEEGTPYSKTAELLNAAEAAGFDWLIRRKKMRSQQNLRAAKCHHCVVH